MPRGYSRFHSVQWSNGGIIVLPNSHSNEFNQSDATLRNSTTFAFLHGAKAKMTIFIKI